MVGRGIKLTQEQCIEQFKEVHGDKYDYSKFVYIDSITKGIIICHKHGRFEQTHHKHKMNRGCPNCGIERRAETHKYSLEKCIYQFKQIHNNLYDYSEFEYKGNNIKGIIICKKHGKFKQTPANHKKNNGCPFCAGKLLLTKNTCIEQFIKIHGNTYDYSEFEYTGSHAKGIIICKIHGKFKQNPTNHKSGNGCRKCSNIVSKIEIEFLNCINVPKEYRQKIMQINNKRFNLDTKIGNLIIEFNGDYWHGNPKIYDSHYINKRAHKTMGELYQKTLEKERTLTEAGYTVWSIWESEWNDMKKKNFQNDKIKCKSYKLYKGVRKPKCGCISCLIKYEINRLNIAEFKEAA